MGGEVFVVHLSDRGGLSTPHTCRETWRVMTKPISLSTIDVESDHTSGGQERPFMTREEPSGLEVVRPVPGQDWSDAIRRVRSRDDSSQIDGAAYVPR